MTPISLYGGQSESFFCHLYVTSSSYCISISNACSSLNLLLSFYLHIIGRKENFVLFSCIHGSRSPVDSSPSTKDESLVSLIYFIHLFIIPLYRVWLSHKRAMFPKNYPSFLFQEHSLMHFKARINSNSAPQIECDGARCVYHQKHSRSGKEISDDAQQNSTG